MSVGVNDIVLPGNTCKDILQEGKKGKIIIGPGIRKDGDRVLITKAGILKKRPPFTYYVDNYQKRYVPAKAENVVGTIIQKSGDIYKVDVGGNCAATLSYLSFEGATKRNRPLVQIGDVVYAKMLVASKDMEPELVCVNSSGKKDRLGILENGFVFTCSINLVRKILNPKCPLLKYLKNEWPFEMAAGMNGRIWINAKTTRETIAVGNAILGAEFLSNDEIKTLCKNIANKLARH